jgi:hypothetical protein
MPQTVRFLVLVVLIVTPATMRADSYGQYPNRRLVEPTGRFYLVVKVLPGGPEDPGRGVPVEIEIAERQAHSPPVTMAADNLNWESDELVVNPDVAVRNGDTLHGRLRLMRAPRKFVISSTGLGFVGLDVYGYNYGPPNPRGERSCDAVVIVSNDGTVRHRKDLTDLFGELAMEQFDVTAGGVWWLGGGWFNERRHELVIVGSEMESKPKSRLFRSVNLDSGEVSHCSTNVVIDALKAKNRGAMELALDLVAELELSDARPYLPAILADEGLPISVRLRAAVAFAKLGDLRGATLVRETALNSGDEYAVKHLVMFFRDGAAPLIRDVLRRFPDQVGHVAWESLIAIGAESVPTLIEMLRDHEHLEGQYVAVDCVDSLGKRARDAVPALVDILRVESKDESLSDLEWKTVHALASVGPEAKDAVALVECLAEHAKARMDEIRARDPDADEFESGLWSAKRKYDDLVESLKKIRRPE